MDVLTWSIVVVADPRVEALLDLAHDLLADNAELITACCRVEEAMR